MSLKIRRATVLGAGVMGAQIAAHLAAAGVRVHLLDLSSPEPPKDPKQAKAVGKNYRAARSILALEQLKLLKPSPIMSPSILTNIIPGNFDDDMSVIAESDWVLEAVVERLDIKLSIHNQIASYVRPGVPVCTNTSGIPLHDIAKDMSESYVKCFFATHFFNPPRYMHLLEVIPLPETDAQLMNDVSNWISENLGKGVVFAFDTVNFIANRIGVFSMQTTNRHMIELGLNFETVDALTGKLIGRPSSATMRTLDVVGVDTYAHVAKNVYDRATDDPERELFLPPNWVNDLIEAGNLGQKNGKGCYAKSKDEQGRRVIKVYRPESKAYEEQNVQLFPWMKELSQERNLFTRLKTIINQDDPGSKLIWNSLRDTMAYSATLVNEIAGGEPKRIDDAMRWGFNWEWGPLELWQGLGFDDILQKMQKDGVKLPNWIKKGGKFYDPDPNSPEWHAAGYSKQSNFKEGKSTEIAKPAHLFYLPKTQNPEDPRVIESNKGASLLDIGNGIALLDFHTKMNAIDMDVITMLQKSVAIVNDRYLGLVIANEGAAFSAGANLKYLLELIEKKDFTAIDTMLRQFQGAMQLLKYAPFPTISCPFSMTLGGGCEVSLHTSYRIVAGETYAGLVEMGVGLIPAGGGTKELALRSYELASRGENTDPMSFLQRAFLLIGMAKVSSSGIEAKEMGLYPEQTFVSLSKEHQIVKAKGLAYQLAKMGYVTPTPKTAIKVVGDPGIQTFKLMLYNMLEGRQISEHDALIGEKVATVLCGGEVDSGAFVSEQYFLDLERRVFLDLCKEEKTKARIEQMLKTGKPLRN
ncbi:MAG: 3-hydroxyacyl-CoA dehydrogenase/enoyl-CoA hydratase family protein [Bdellovibrionota bacterium]